MNTKKVFFLAVLGALFVMANVLMWKVIWPEYSPQDYETPYVPGELIIQFNSEVTAEQMNLFFEKYKLTLSLKLVSINGAAVKLPEELDVPAAIELFKKDPLVKDAEPNYIFQAT